jgi:polysaccharide pyruvyl transferase CsaB
MLPTERPVRIGISGSYGGLNLGDEAILHSIVKQLRESLSLEITVFTRDPEDTRRRHGVDRAVEFGKQTREEARAEVKRFDLLILGGGGILYDRDAEMYLREVALANEEGVPVVVYAVSAGPLEKGSMRELVLKHLTPAAAITVRDRQGLNLLEELGISREIQRTADPALLLEPELPADDVLKSEGLEIGRRLVGFSVREPGPAAPDMDVEHYHALLANTADFMVDRLDAEVVFVPMEHKKTDVQHSHAVVAQMQCAQRARVLKAEYSSAQLLGLLGHFQFAVGMRLHFLIFSALQGVPFVALPYASKVEGFIEDLEMPMPPLKQVTTGRLIAHIDRCWDQQDALRERMQRRLPALQQRARETHKIVMQVLSGTELLRGKRRGAA